MGIFKFVRDAGETLGRAIGIERKTDEDDLKKALTDNGLSIQNLTLDLDKHVATIGGQARSRADLEKAVLVIGNTRGVEEVRSNLTLPAPPAAPPVPNPAPQPVQATSAAVPSAAPAQAPVQGAAEPESRFHTVAKGDTLWKIAERMYGDGSKFQSIFQANTPMLKHPDKIYPGQVLRVPPLD